MNASFSSLHAALPQCLTCSLCSTQQGRPVGGFLFLPHLLWNNFGLDKAADLIYDKAEGCCPEKRGGGGCPEEEI